MPLPPPPPPPPLPVAAAAGQGSEFIREYLQVATRKEAAHVTLLRPAAGQVGWGAGGGCWRSGGGVAVPRTTTAWAGRGVDAPLFVWALPSALLPPPPGCSSLALQSVPASAVAPASGPHFQLLKQAILETLQPEGGAAGPMPVAPFLLS